MTDCLSVCFILDNLSQSVLLPEEDVSTVGNSQYLKLHQSKTVREEGKDVARSCCSTTTLVWEEKRERKQCNTSKNEKYFRETCFTCLLRDFQVKLHCTREEAYFSFNQDQRRRRRSFSVTILKRRSKSKSYQFTARFSLYF